MTNISTAIMHVDPRTIGTLELYINALVYRYGQTEFNCVVDILPWPVHNVDRVTQFINIGCYDHLHIYIVWKSRLEECLINVYINILDMQIYYVNN